MLLFKHWRRFTTLAHRDETPDNAGRRGTNGERREICRGDGPQLRIYQSIEVDRDLSDVSCCVGGEAGAGEGLGAK